MNESERNDLLITLSANMKEMCRRMSGVEDELKKRRCILHESKISDLESEFDPNLCVVHTQKLNLLLWVGAIVGTGVIGLVLERLWHILFPVAKAVTVATIG